MVSAMLSGTEEMTGHEEEGVAHAEGIGGGTPYEREDDSTGLSQGGDPHELFFFLSRCCTWIHKVTSGYI